VLCMSWENVEVVVVVLTISTTVEEAGEADSAASRLCKGEPRQHQSRRDVRSGGNALHSKRWKTCSAGSISDAEAG